jgi:hypothetical protein
MMTKLEKVVMVGTFVVTGVMAAATVSVWTYLISKYDC